MSSNNSAYLLVPTIVLTVLAAFFVTLRFWARRLRNIPPGLDDYLALAALVLQCGVTVIAICAVVYGGVGQDVEIVMKKNVDGLQIMLKASLFTSNQRLWNPKKLIRL